METHGLPALNHTVNHRQPTPTPYNNLLPWSSGTAPKSFGFTSGPDKTVNLVSPTLWDPLFECPSSMPTATTPASNAPIPNMETHGLPALNHTVNHRQPTPTPYNNLLPWSSGTAPKSFGFTSGPDKTVNLVSPTHWDPLFECPSSMPTATTPASNAPIPNMETHGLPALNHTVNHRQPTPTPYNNLLPWSSGTAPKSFGFTSGPDKTVNLVSPTNWDPLFECPSSMPTATTPASNAPIPNMETHGLPALNHTVNHRQPTPTPYNNLLPWSSGTAPKSFGFTSGPDKTVNLVSPTHWDPLFECPSSMPTATTPASNAPIPNMETHGLPALNHTVNHRQPTPPPYNNLLPWSSGTAPKSFGFTSGPDKTVNLVSPTHWDPLFECPSSMPTATTPESNAPIPNMGTHGLPALYHTVNHRQPTPTPYNNLLPWSSGTAPKFGPDKKENLVSPTPLGNLFKLPSSMPTATTPASRWNGTPNAIGRGEGSGESAANMADAFSVSCLPRVIQKKRRLSKLLDKLRAQLKNNNNYPRPRWQNPTKDDDGPLDLSIKVRLPQPAPEYACNGRLAKHVASRHRNRTPDAARTYECNTCSRRFSRSDMLSRHARLHSGLKPYSCKLCGQVFSRSDHLATHQRTHTGEKPYRCPACPYAACRRDMITRHMKTHTRQPIPPEA